MNQLKKQRNMSTNNKFLKVVESYHSMYVSYRSAHTNLKDKKEQLIEKLKPLLEKSTSEDKDFKEMSKDYLSMISTYPQEVNFFATKFVHAADLYIIVTEEELPEEISRDYIQLKGIEYKSSFSIKKGKFVKNSSADLPTIPDKEYDNIFRFLKMEFDTK